MMQNCILQLQYKNTLNKDTPSDSVKNIYNTSHSVAIDVKIITYSYNLNDQIILNRLPYSIRYILIYDPSTYSYIYLLYFYSIYTILIYIVRE